MKFGTVVPSGLGESALPLGLREMLAIVRPHRPLIYDLGIVVRGEYTTIIMFVIPSDVVGNPSEHAVTQLPMTISPIPPYIVFGYGSLIFKPPPHVIKQVPGFLKGYVRRFAQQSHDHRGTPENPGRVVTLIHKEDWTDSDPFPEDDIVWGVAYTIDPAYVSDVRDYLDYREKDGYTLETLDIYGIDQDTNKAKVIIHGAYCYVGRKDNPSFVGSEPIDKLAERIWRSIGPSGTNKDYLFKLASCIRDLSPDSFDSHLFTLEAKVRQLDADHIQN